MPRPRAARQTANTAAYARGWRGARGGTAGAARASGRAWASDPAQARRHERAAARAGQRQRQGERLYAEGVGRSPADALRAWQRITHDGGATHRYMISHRGQYQSDQDGKGGMLGEAWAQAQAQYTGVLTDRMSDALLRELRRWDSEFNRLYRAALRDHFRHRMRGAYHRLLVYLGWRNPREHQWAAGNTPTGSARRHAYEIRA